MKYIKMFDNLNSLEVKKSTKEKYKKIINFIKTRELADRLDKLKVPMWYIEIFADGRWFDIGFIHRIITHEERNELFEKLLVEPQEVKYRKEKTLLWKLKNYESYTITGYLSKWKFTILTDEEIKERERLRLIAKAEYEKKHEEYRRKYGSVFNLDFFNIENHYETLGLKKGATKQEIKKAYRNLSKKYHPDMGGSNEKFNEINTAYRALYK